MGLLDSIKNIFKSSKKETASISSASFGTFNFRNVFNAKDNNILNIAVNTNARNFSKIQPQVYYKGSVSKNKSALNYILRIKPNPLTNGPTFWEQVAKEYYLSSNVFIYPEYDFQTAKEPLKALWIVPSENIEVVFNNNQYFYKFVINNQTYHSSSDEMIHLTRNIGNLLNVIGSSDPSIKRIIDLIETNYEGMELAIKNSSLIKYLISTATLMDEKEKVERSKAFAETLKGSKEGIAFLDGAEQFQQIDTSKTKYMGEETMKLLKQQIYDNFGVNEKIINSSFNEEDWQAYYESVIEPLVMKLETELTEKLLSKREREFENEIVVNSNRLQTASLKTRLAVAQTIQKSPIHRPNDVLNLLFQDPIEGGDKPFIFLNYQEADLESGYKDLEKEEGEKNNE